MSIVALSATSAKVKGSLVKPYIEPEFFISHSRLSGTASSMTPFSNLALIMSKDDENAKTKRFSFDTVTSNSITRIDR